MGSHDDVRVALAAHDLLGEGPWWDEDLGRLVRVDIKAGAVRWWHPGTGTTGDVTLPEEVSLAVPRRGGGLLVTQVDRVCLVAADGTLTDLATIDADNPHTRLNDGVCDEAGRLWVGTYSPRWQPDAGLHVVEPDGSTRQVLDGLIASNGLAWDGDLLYAVDTGRAVVDRFRRTDSGLAPLDPLVQGDPETDRPDGIALDAQGAVWVAMWGGHQVRRYLPDGTLDRIISVPVSMPTSVAFGGPDLADLFITTCSYSLPAGHDETAAGSVLTVRPGVRGVGVRRFAG